MARGSRLLKEWVKVSLRRLPLSDRCFTRIMYLLRQRRILHLTPPRTFGEKLQWLKLYSSTEQYSALADKYAVREYVAKRIGKEYLNELYGVYDRVADIDFGVFPKAFVLKPTHGSGWIIICHDKSTLDIDVTRRRLSHWLTLNYYDAERESIYKDIHPKIVCERLLEDNTQNGLTDYKFFCFEGRAKFIQINYNRRVQESIKYCDLDWQLLPFHLARYPTDDSNPDKPNDSDKMREVVETLAKGVPFVRVDMFNSNGKIIFGEMTFCPGGGFERIVPFGWDFTLGNYLKLPSPHLGNKAKSPKHRAK